MPPPGARPASSTAGWTAAVVGALFAGVDLGRRSTGLALDALGLGPRTTPGEVVHEETGLRLHHHPAPGDGPPLLIVPAPIKAHWIWDLAPGCSVVAAATARGSPVWLLEWTDTPASWGLDAHVDAVARMVSRVARAAGAAPHVAGHSLGGTLAALAVARHKPRAASLVLVESPLRFGEATGGLARVVDGWPADGAAEMPAQVPGSLLALGASAACPREFVAGGALDAAAAMARGPAAWRRHRLARRWVLHERPMPGRLLADLVRQLYREDRFAQGRLRIAGRTVSPRDLALPVAAVVDPRSEVVPAASVTDAVDACASRERLVLTYPGDVGVALQHLGALIGEHAHRELWPRLFDWMRDVSPPRR